MYSILVLSQRCQTHFHQGPHQSHSCLQRTEIILGLYKHNYSLTVKELKLHLALWRHPQGWCGPRWKWVWHPCHKPWGKGLPIHIFNKLSQITLIHDSLRTIILDEQCFETSASISLLCIPGSLQLVIFRMSSPYWINLIATKYFNDKFHFALSSVSWVLAHAALAEV